MRKEGESRETLVVHQLLVLLASRWKSPVWSRRPKEKGATLDFLTFPIVPTDEND